MKNQPRLISCLSDILFAALLAGAGLTQAAVITIKLDFGKDNQAPNIDFSNGGNWNTLVASDLTGSRTLTNTFENATEISIGAGSGWSADSANDLGGAFMTAGNDFSKASEDILRTLAGSNAMFTLSGFQATDTIAVRLAAARKDQDSNTGDYKFNGAFGNGSAPLNGDGFNVGINGADDVSEMTWTLTGTNAYTFTLDDTGGFRPTINGMILQITPVLTELVASNAPSALAATNTGSIFSIDLSWTLNSDSHEGIVIERGTNGTDFAFLAYDEGSGANTTYTDGTCLPGNTYYYRVAASNSISQLHWSNVSSASTPPAAGNIVFLASEHGIVADGVSNNTSMLQALIDTCSRIGGGTVKIDTGTVVSGTINLKHNVTLEVAAGATLMNTGNKEDYPFVPVNFLTYYPQRRAMVYAQNQTNIAVVGEGTIDGDSDSYDRSSSESARVSLIRFDGCTNAVVRDLRLQNASMWSQHYYRCDQLEISGLSVFNDMKNDDGLNIDGCSNVLITDCDIRANDDCITLKNTSHQLCENVVVSNCVLSSSKSAFKFGTESYDGFKNVHASNLTITGGRDALALFSVDGAHMENILVEDVTITDTRCPLVVLLGARLRTIPGDPQTLETGSVKGITVRNVTATGAERAIMLAGLTNHPVREIHLENVDVTFKTDSSSNKEPLPNEVVEENPTGYPSSDIFGRLNAWGLFVRHARDISLHNVSLQHADSSAAPMAYFEDVDIMNLPSAIEAEAVYNNDGYTVAPAVIAIQNGSATNVQAGSAWLTYDLTATGTASTAVSVYYGKTDGGYVPAAWENSQLVVARNADIGTGSQFVSGLDAADTTYYYRFHAANSNESAWATGPAAEFSMPFVFGNAPSSLSATNDRSPYVIDLSWTINSQSHLGFVIERGTNGTDFTHLAFVARSAATYSDSSCAPESTYFYRVAASNHYGLSEWSNIAGADTTPVPDPPVAVNLGASGVGVGTATLHGSISGRVNGKLYLCWEEHDAAAESSLADWENVVDMGVDVDNAVVAHTLYRLADAATDYDFAWYAENIGGSDWSSTGSFTTSNKVLTLLDYANPFFGNDGTDLPVPQGIACAWNWEKAQNGNTHPGPQLPFGMVSVTPYSGGYPTGYGANKKTFKGAPQVDERLLDSAYGFTHFQQSGTGDMGTFYNLLRVFPLTEEYSADNRKTLFKMEDMQAHPGYFACAISNNGVYVQITASDKVAYHKYSFPPASGTKQIGVELTAAGLGDTPSKVLKVDADKLDENTIGGKMIADNFPYYFVMQVSGTATGGGFHGQDAIDYNSDGSVRRIYPVTTSATHAEISINRLRSGFDKNGGQPHYIDYFFDVEPEVEIKVAFSFRSLAQAQANLAAAPADFDTALAEAEASWMAHLERIPYEAENEEKKELFYSCLYHSLTKPSICDNESPWWSDENFVTDVSTLWDVYKTQFPLVFKYYPEHGEKIVKSIVNAMDYMEQEEGYGFFPVGFFKSDRFTKFAGQTTGMEWPVLAYAYTLFPNMDPQVWQRALSHVDGFASNSLIQEILATGKGTGRTYSHAIDVASAFNSICFLARHTGNDAIYNTYAGLRDTWTNVYDAATGLLVDDDHLPKAEKYYEGNKWNYSFRPHYDMEKRVALAGGKEAFAELLDEFFGYKDIEDGIVDPDPVTFERLQRPGHFEGLNNECDMETPFAYLWSSKPERAQEVIDAVMEHQFATGRHGLPGNNDSGALTSWYVLNAIGDFPLIEALVLQPAPMRTQVTAGGTSLNISWPSWPPESYRLLSRTNLLTGTWTTNATGITATAPTNSLDIAIPAGNGSGFYKLELE